ncbi:MAG: hypothetical protein WDW38_001194 [Sanguina aurantia]
MRGSPDDGPTNLAITPRLQRDGLIKDPGTGSVYMHSDESLYEVLVSHEARDMWAVYLALQDWEQALRLCSSSAQRDDVHRAWAEAAALEGDFMTAALHFAKILGGSPTFEDVALQLVEAASASGSANSGLQAASGSGGDALQLFLLTKLGVLGKSDRAQSTMLASWLTELLLDQLNRALLESGGQAEQRYSQLESAMRGFLKEHVEILDPNTTLTLLATYGRLEDLVHYAACRNDTEGLLEVLTSRPGGTARALAVLRKPSVSPELVYKFAPSLVASGVEATVDFLITQQPPLDPRRLIPALLRFGDGPRGGGGRGAQCPGSAAAQQQHVLRYVEFAVDTLGCQDSAVHNLAVALHTLSEGEAGLLGYLGRGRDPLGRPLYDPKYALRLCTERGRRRAVVQLLCELGMYPDAVRKALDMDLELAKAVANAPEDDDPLRRKLWLEVARHVVQCNDGNGGKGRGGSGDGGSSGSSYTGVAGAIAAVRGVDQSANIKKAVEFLKEAGGLLKIEDILPFFPDFVTIDNFREAICESLTRYNAAIEGLKEEMDEATAIAAAVRKDIAVLGCRTATVSLSSPCAACGRPMSERPPPNGLPSGGALPPFYVFPSGLTYHASCCAHEVGTLVGPQQRAKIAALFTRLAKSHMPAPASAAPPHPGKHPPASQPSPTLSSALTPGYAPAAAAAAAPVLGGAQATDAGGGGLEGTGPAGALGRKTAGAETAVLELQASADLTQGNDAHSRHASDSHFVLTQQLSDRQTLLHLAAHPLTILTCTRSSPVQLQLAEEVASEDPRNGEVVVRLLDLPFVTESDRAEIESWLV